MIYIWCYFLFTIYLQPSIFIRCLPESYQQLRNLNKEALRFQDEDTTSNSNISSINMSNSMNYNGGNANMNNITNNHSTNTNMS